MNLVNGVFDGGMRPFIRIREWAWTEVLREAVHVNRSLVFTFKPQATIRSSFISLAEYRKQRDQGAFQFRTMPTPAVKIDTSECTPAEAAHRIVAILDT